MTAATAILIPAYRPGVCLTEIVAGLLEAGAGPVVVVDDGSGAEFATLFAELAARHGVTVLRHAVNLGKGAALKTGFNHALITWPELAGVVTADADGQHTVADIVRVARHLSSHPAALVLGVRAFRGEVPLRSRLGNSITRSVFRIFTGMDLCDTQTGLRGWPRRYLMDSLPVAINGYDFELECLLRARGGALAIEQVPIETVYTPGNGTSHFNPIRDSTRIYFVFLRYCGASILAAVLDATTFTLIHSATGSIAAGQVAGRALAVAVAFLIARNVVFRSEASVWRSLAKYLSLVAVAGMVSYAFIGYLMEEFHWPALGAKLTAEGLLFLANFAIQRELVFVRAKGNGS